MDYNTQNVNPANPVKKGVVNGRKGTWVPVDPDSVPFPVAGDAFNPSVAPDGNVYFAENRTTPDVGAGPIAANRNNAIPIPSSIVQLPPIVQPIALVPYSTQNQPMVQYDPDYREEIPRTNTDPVYKPRPYTGLSFVCAFLAVAGILFALFLPLAKTGITALDAALGALGVFGVSSVGSMYYDGVLAPIFSDGLSAGFSANTGLALMSLLVPICYALTVILLFVSVIYYIVKMGKGSSPRGFNVVNLIALIFSIVSLALLIVMKETTQDLGSYVIPAVIAASLILPAFAKRGAVVIDYPASKRLYGNVKWK